MIGQYKGFITENIAPKGVNTISIYDESNTKKASMAVPEFMKYPNETPLYSFGVIADAHIAESNNGDGLDFALNYFKQNGAVMACVCGDITNAGFYKDETLVNDTWQFAKFKEIKDKYADSSFNIYAITGNHDSYYKAITEDLDLYQSYVGQGLYYSVSQGNDVFLFVGQPTAYTAFNSEQLAWLQSQLSENSNKRCFVFIHPYIPNDSGNPFACYGNDILSVTSGKADFLSALKAHGNVTLFHGHSHFIFTMQELDKANNFTNKNGFNSVHVPSCQFGSIVTYDENGNPQRIGKSGAAQGYLVEVFDDFIILNGVDFSVENGQRNTKLVPQGILKIDT